MKALGILALFGALLGNSFAMDEIKAQHLFIKMQDQVDLPRLNNAQTTKKLFGSLYLVKTNNLKELQNELKGIEKIQYTQINQKSKERVLAQEARPPEIDIVQMLNSPFNDPDVGRLWAFKDSSDHGISVNKAYLNRSTQPREEIIVAVVDTGVDYNHDELKNVMWVNEGEIPGNNIDDDGNGYVDDIHGIDTLDRGSDDIPSGNPMDQHNHGTHVSGTIAAEQNNNKGIAGIASHVKIMAIRAVPNQGDETDVDVVESFLYAAKNGAKIINCSFGKKNNEGGMVVSETIKHIGEEYGVLVIAAAGNDSSNIDKRPIYPASFDNDHLLVVGSSSNWGRMSFFSNYGIKNVDVAAPGSSIYSTVRGNRYASYSGTSMASPTTAGLAAEILAHKPELSPLQLKALIMETVNSKSSMSKKVLTGGLIDLHLALQKTAQ